MAATIKHAFTSPKADGPHTDLLQPSHWNADHAVTGVVESVIAGTNITVDNTDPANPIISSTGGGGGTSDHEALSNLQGGTTGQHVHLTDLEYNFLYGQMPGHTANTGATLTTTTETTPGILDYMCLLRGQPIITELGLFPYGTTLRLINNQQGQILKGCYDNINDTMVSFYGVGTAVELTNETAVVDACGALGATKGYFKALDTGAYYLYLGGEIEGDYYELTQGNSVWYVYAQSFMGWVYGLLAWGKIDKTGALPSDIGAAPTYHAHQAGIERDEVTNLLPAITSGTSTLTVAAGSVWMYDEADMDSLTLHTIAASGELWSSLGTDVPSFVCADRDTNTWVVLHSGTTPTTFDYVRYVPYFVANKRSSSTHLHNQIDVLLAHGAVEAIHKTKTDCGRYDRAEGALLNLSCADTTLLLGLSGGRVYATYYPYDIPALSSATDQFKCVLASGVWSYTRQTGGATLANTEYNGAAGMVTMTDGKYALLYVWRGIENEDHVYTYYSTQEYDSLALANAAGLEANIPPLASGHAMFVGRIPFLKGQTTGFTGYSAFDTTFAAATAITVHNSLSGLNSGDYNHLTAAQLSAFHGITISTADPSGGSNGDIWIKYTP